MVLQFFVLELFAENTSITAKQCLTRAGDVCEMEELKRAYFS